MILKIICQYKITVQTPKNNLMSPVHSYLTGSIVKLDSKRENILFQIKPTTEKQIGLKANYAIFFHKNSHNNSLWFIKNTNKTILKIEKYSDYNNYKLADIDILYDRKNQTIQVPKTQCGLLFCKIIEQYDVLSVYIDNFGKNIRITAPIIIDDKKIIIDLLFSLDSQNLTVEIHNHSLENNSFSLNEHINFNSKYLLFFQDIDYNKGIVANMDFQHNLSIFVVKDKVISKAILGNLNRLSLLKNQEVPSLLEITNRHKVYLDKMLYIVLLNNEINRFEKLILDQIAYYDLEIAPMIGKYKKAKPKKKPNQLIRFIRDFYNKNKEKLNLQHLTLNIILGKKNIVAKVEKYLELADTDVVNKKQTLEFLQLETNQTIHDNSAVTKNSRYSAMIDGQFQAYITKKDGSIGVTLDQDESVIYHLHLGATICNFKNKFHKQMVVDSVIEIIDNMKNNLIFIRTLKPEPLEIKSTYKHNNPLIYTININGMNVVVSGITKTVYSKIPYFDSIKENPAFFIGHQFKDINKKTIQYNGLGYLCTINNKLQVLVMDSYNNTPGSRAIDNGPNQITRIVDIFNIDSLMKYKYKNLNFFNNNCICATKVNDTLTKYIFCIWGEIDKSIDFILLNVKKQDNYFYADDYISMDKLYNGRYTIQDTLKKTK